MNLNRKAILLPEALKLIIAAICILALVYLGISMYDLMRKKSEIEQTRATLDAIINKVNSLTKEGEITKYFVNAPKDRYLVYYNFDVVSADKEKSMPQACAGSDCLCICGSKFSSNSFYKKAGIDRCVVCKPIQTKLDISKTSLIASGLKTQFILFDKVPYTLYLKKQGETVIIADMSPVLAESTLNNLLNKQIDFNGQKNILFSNFLKIFIGNNCHYDNGKVQASSESEAKAEEIIKAYIDEIIKQSREEIRVYYVDKQNKEHEILSKVIDYFSTMANGILIESKEKICEDEFTLYIEYSSKKDPKNL